MSKQITSSELAMLTTQLLLDPSSVGQDFDHAHFCTAIAQTIADFCGGHANTTGQNDAFNADNPSREELTDLSRHLTSVYPNDSLPSLKDCVWSPFDLQGWDDESHDELEIPDGEPITISRAKHEKTVMAQTMLQAALHEIALNGINGVTATIERNTGNGVAKTKVAFIDDGVLIDNSESKTFFEPLSPSSHSITHFHDSDEPQKSISFAHVGSLLLKGLVQHQKCQHLD